MKISKKMAMGISLAIGTLMFATTAFAEVASKNGYEQLKDALKFSAESCSGKLQNYTVKSSFILKDGSMVVNQEDSVNKYDNSKNAVEYTSTTVNGNGTKYEGYNYADLNCDIFYDREADTYHETDYTTAKKENYFNFSNPFKQKGSSDVERIVDAVVGNLKDYVVVNQKTDGSKEFSGSISQAQIPAVANAVVSYAVKNRFGEQYTRERLKIDKITDDIYVKEVKGNAVAGKDGLLQSIIGTGVISGKDEKGNAHELTFEVLVKLENVNSTSVKKPDVTGKKVVKETKDNDGDSNAALDNPQLYIGTYKNDIVIKKDNKFQKIGERIVEVTSIDNKKLSGRYHEEYTKGNEEYSKNAKDIKFDANVRDSQKDYYNYVIQGSGTNNSGNISINSHSSAISFYYSGIDANHNELDDSQYMRVFD